MNQDAAARSSWVCRRRLALEEYRASGFAVVREAVDAPTVAILAEAVERIQRMASELPPELADRLVFERDLPASKRGGIPSDQVGDAVFIIGDPALFDPCFLEFVVHSQVLALAAGALESDNLECHLVNVTMKRPLVGSGIAWHRDFPNSYICPSTPRFVRIMLCLDDVDETNGASGFVAASHLVSKEERSKAIPQPPIEKVSTPICPSGSLVLIHPLVLHGGPPNASRRARRNLVVQWGLRTGEEIGPEREALTGLSPDEIKARLTSS